MKTANFPIVKEGFPFILFSAFVALICALFAYQVAALIGVLATGFITWFFRDPSRTLPDDKEAVICPADGRVIVVDQCLDDRFLQQQAVKISIFMNIFNVHVNRVPFRGSVQKILFKPGRFYSADKDKAALHNEYCAMIVKTPSGWQYASVQIAGLIARRIICWAEQGDELKTGIRYGLIRFGSRVDLYLPPESDIRVTVGQKVKAGETILARPGRQDA